MKHTNRENGPEFTLSTLNRLGVKAPSDYLSKMISCVLWRLKCLKWLHPFGSLNSFPRILSLSFESRNRTNCTYSIHLERLSHQMLLMYLHNGKKLKNKKKWAWENFKSWLKWEKLHELLDAAFPEFTSEKGGFKCCKTIQRVLHMKHNGAIILNADKLFTFISTDKLPMVLSSLIHFRAGIRELCSNLISKDFFFP